MNPYQLKSDLHWAQDCDRSLFIFSKWWILEIGIYSDGEAKIIIYYERDAHTPGSYLYLQEISR